MSDADGLLPPPEPQPGEPADPSGPAGSLESSAPVGALQVYALPTARKVVSSGLQLALASTGDLRRASIYIGLLVLGSFGPAAIAILLILGRLGDQAGDAFGSVFIGPSYGAPPQPALEAALLVVSIEALVGLLLFLTISIDAQSMAVAILGGRAGDRPLRLWEAIIRARQAFWRMAGAGAVVGVVSVLVQGFVGTALGGFSRSVDAASIVAGIIATIAVAPLAYVATGIVLGDVSATESLARSWRLFKARRMLAVVVVLFTFVTSAIQLFALSSGLDLIVRASELLHVSLTEGVVAFGIAIVLILAAVVAYGSLTFTIGAIVSAPQVAGFLGLTFYSGGLDRARVEGAKPPRGFRYISRPMTVAMIALTGIVGLEIPAINSIPTPVPTPAAAMLRAEAEAHDFFLSPAGYLDPKADPLADSGSSSEADIALAEYAFLPLAPAWLLEETFDCDLANVACGQSLLSSSYQDGAYLFAARIAGGGAGLARCAPCTFGPVVSVLGEARVPSDDPGPFSGVSRAFLTTIDKGTGSNLVFRWFGNTWTGFQTRARALWRDGDFFFLIPSEEIPSEVLEWNVRFETHVDGATGVDRLGGESRLLLPFTDPPALWLDPEDAFLP